MGGFVCFRELGGSCIIQQGALAPFIGGFVVVLSDCLIALLLSSMLSLDYLPSH